MTKLKSFALYITCSLFCVSCFNAPEYPDVPEIQLKEIRKSRGTPFSGDSVIVVLSFKDGNGDLGKRNSLDTVPNLFIIDKRFGVIDSFSYSIPNIPQNGSVKDVSGNIDINLLSKIYCNPLFPGITKDTLEFTFQVRDRAGNFSNMISTGAFEIICQ
jgi:hypothetical protein